MSPAAKLMVLNTSFPNMNFHLIAWTLSAVTTDAKHAIIYFSANSGSLHSFGENMWKLFLFEQLYTVH